MKKVNEFIDEFLGQKNTLFLSLAVILFVILRFPTTIEPYWYGDEGIYEVIGSSLSQGKILYSQVWDNKPPLLYVIYALFAGDQFWVRILSLIFGVASVIVFFALSRKIFKEKFSILISTLFFAFMFGSPVLEGNIANAENFFILPVLCAFYILFGSKTKNIKKYFYAGILFSLAFLIKTVTLFDFAGALFTLFVVELSQAQRLNMVSIQKSIAQILVSKRLIFLGFLIPIFLTSIYFLAVGAFPDFISAVFSQNVEYVAYGNFFIIQNGLIILKAAILLIALVLIIRFRKKLTVGGLLIFTWLAFELFSTFFSARPYTHYLLAVLPAFSLFLGFIYDDKKARAASLVILVFVLFVLNKNFQVHKKIIPYYSNYLSYVMGGNINTYQVWFDKNTPRDYALVDFIKSNTNKNENVFLWSDSGQIYAMSGKNPPGRYVVAYHIVSNPGAISETKAAVDKAAPKYIIQTKDDNSISNFLEGYDLRYIIDKAKIYERQP